MPDLSVLSLLAQGSILEPRQPYIPVAIGFALLVAGLIAFDYSTRAGTIARATTKEAVRQPVFYLITLISLMVIVVNYYVPFFSLGADTKIFIDCGLASILIGSLLLAIWTASLSVADEIEGKTAMTLLSKPINRRQFVLGKYVGILQAALILIVVVGIPFFVMTYFKFGYDMREQAQGNLPLVTWRVIMGVNVPQLVPERANVALNIVPTLALILMEVAAMTAISVAISTRLPMLVNLVACFAIFVVGHLTEVLVYLTAQREGLEPVTFMAQVVATILPSLATFNMTTAVDTGQMIPAQYLGFSVLYCVSYTAAAVLLAFILFEDRDLA